MTKHRRSEKGQAGLEFVIVVPVLMIAIIILGITGNLLYHKLSSQNFTYSHCMWETTGIRLYARDESAFSLSVDQTKRTWNTEGLWESYPTNEWGSVEVHDQNAFFTKKCVGSVTHDEWGVVGAGYFQDYNPDVLVESKLSVTRSRYKNYEDFPISLQALFLMINTDPVEED
jgi:hypothetical protein